MNREADDMDFLTQSCIRGSRAIADKIDVGCGIRQPNDEHLKTIKNILKQGGYNPTHIIDFFKNRGSKYNQVRIWLEVDLATGRFKEYFLTDTSGNQIPTDVMFAEDSEAKLAEEEIENILNGKDIIEEEEQEKVTITL